jgi:hypothetical protein
MDVLLLDIAETLQATDVRLPNGEAVVAVIDNRGDNDIVEISGSEAWTEDDIPDADDIFQSAPIHVTPSERMSPSASRGRLPSGMNILARDMDQVHI